MALEPCIIQDNLYNTSSTNRSHNMWKHELKTKWRRLTKKGKIIAGVCVVVIVYIIVKVI